MGTVGKYMLTDADRTRLLRARELHEELEKMEEGLRELRLLSVSLKSPKMDDMPKAPGSGDTMTATLARIERQEGKIARVRAKLRGEVRSAARVVKRLTGPFKAFCEAYYVDGDPFAVAQATSGVKERQCKRYMAIVACEETQREDD